jgi:hypothetical protein
MSSASFRRFWAVAADRNSSLAPFGPRRRNRSSLRVRLRCATSRPSFVRDARRRRPRSWRSRAPYRERLHERSVRFCVQERAGSTWSGARRPRSHACARSRSPIGEAAMFDERDHCRRHVTPAPHAHDTRVIRQFIGRKPLRCHRRFKSRSRSASPPRSAPFSRERIVARISFFKTFPTFERGRSGQMSTCFGALTLPMRAFTK